MFVSKVLLEHNVFCVKSDVPTVTHLVKQISRYQNHVNISVVNAFCK